MQAIRVLRGASRSSSPAPHASSGLDDYSSNSQPRNTLSRIQSITKLRSGNGSKGMISSGGPTTPVTPAPTTLVQDGSYLNALSLKLNEATSKAVAPVIPGGTGYDVLNGRRPIPAGRGRLFGQLISSELIAAHGNPNLERAILRLLPRSLSVLVASLSAQVAPLLATPGYVPASCIANFEPATLHGLGIATLAAELLETFAAQDLASRSPDLAAIKNALENSITRLVAPLFGALQSELLVAIEAAGKPAVYKGKPHPSIQHLQTLVPHFVRVLKRLATPCCAVTESQLAALIIQAVWSAMVVLSHRPVAMNLHQGPSPPTSPPQAKALVLPNRTPPPTPKLSLFKDSPGSRIVSLPGLSRPSTPPVSNPLSLDSKALWDILKELPRPPVISFAGEAVQEALERLEEFKNWVVDSGAREGEESEDVPLLIAMAVVFSQRLGIEGGAERFFLFPQSGPGEYRKRCLGGFGKAEQWAGTVGLAVVESLRAALYQGRELGDKEEAVEEVCGWIVRKVGGLVP